MVHLPPGGRQGGAPTRGSMGMRSPLVVPRARATLVSSSPRSRQANMKEETPLGFVVPDSSSPAGPTAADGADGADGAATGDAAPSSGATVSGTRGIAAETIPERVGPYRALRILGRGGMGVVYEGVHEATGTRVAL